MLTTPLAEWAMMGEVSSSELLLLSLLPALPVEAAPAWVWAWVPVVFCTVVAWL